MTKQKLLIFHFGALGDVICLFPSLAALKKSCLIHLAAGGKIGRLAGYLGLAEKYFSIDDLFFLPLFQENPGRAEKLKGFLRNYDAVLFFSFNKEAAEKAAGVAGIKPFVFSPRPQLKPVAPVFRHLAEQLVQSEFLSSFDAPDPEKEKGKHKEMRNNAEKKVLLHPGSGSPKKNWPLKRFTEAGDILKNNGFSPVYFFGPAEDQLLHEFMASVKGGQTYFRSSDLIHLYEAIKNSAGFIGNDSGVSHLAGYAGVPTVVVFGPSDPRIWKPFGPYVEAIHDDCGKGPCFGSDGINCLKSSCLHNISSERTVAAYLHIYRYFSVC